MPGATRVAWLGLGSNLDGPRERLMQALAALDAVSTRVLAVSPFYRTAPVGGPPGQPAYCNACAAIAFDGTSLALLDRLQAIEREQGRVRDVRWGPRVLDLDMLAVDDERITHPRLDLPHPRAHRRAFVLVPLADIAPALVLGGAGRVADLRATCDMRGVARWDAA